MANVSVQRLSFGRDFKHAYSTVALRLQKGAKSLDGVLELLRMRIEAEVQFTNSLQKIINASTKLMSHINPTETLRSEGLDALYTDLKNEYTQRLALLNSLKQDVQKPLSTMKEFCYSQNKNFSNQTKNNLKTLKQQQNEFSKLKTKYDKVMNATGDKSKKKKHQLLMVKKRFHQQQYIWQKQQEIYDNKTILTLQNMQSNEYKRMNSFRDALINWSAFITNYCANRSYDIKELAQSMSLINIEHDLQLWMTKTLHQCPSPLPSPISQKQHITYHNNVYFKVPPMSKLNKQRSASSMTSSSTDYFQTYFKQKYKKQSYDQSVTVSSKYEFSDDED